MSLHRSPKVSKRYNPVAAAGSTRRTRSATKLESLNQEQNMVAGPSSLMPMASVGASQKRSKGKGRLHPVLPPTLGPFSDPIYTPHPYTNLSTFESFLVSGTIDPSLLSLPSRNHAGPSTRLPSPVMDNTNSSPPPSPLQPLSDADSKQFIQSNLTRSQSLCDISDGPLRREIERHLRQDARGTVPFTCCFCPQALDSVKEWLAHTQSAHNINLRDGDVMCPFSKARHSGKRIPSFYVHHFGERSLCTGCWETVLIRGKDKSTRHSKTCKNAFVVKHFLLDHHPHKDRVLRMEEVTENVDEFPVANETTPGPIDLPSHPAQEEPIPPSPELPQFPPPIVPNASQPLVTESLMTTLLEIGLLLPPNPAIDDILDQIPGGFDIY